MALEALWDVLSACAGCSGESAVGGTGPGGVGAIGANDIATNVGTGLAVDSALEIAGGAAGRAGATGLLGLLFAIFGGAQTAAEGYMAIKKSKGRGFGGASNAAEEAMNQIQKDKEDRQRLAEQMRDRTRDYYR